MCRGSRRCRLPRVYLGARSRAGFEAGTLAPEHYSRPHRRELVFSTSRSTITSSSTSRPTGRRSHGPQLRGVRLRLAGRPCRLLSAAARAPWLSEFPSSALQRRRGVHLGADDHARLAQRRGAGHCELRQLARQHQQRRVGGRCRRCRSRSRRASCRRARLARSTLTSASTLSSSSTVCATWTRRSWSLWIDWISRSSRAAPSTGACTRDRVVEEERRVGRVVAHDAARGAAVEELDVELGRLEERVSSRRS